MTDSTKKHPPESNDLRARLGMKVPAASPPPSRENPEGSVGGDPFSGISSVQGNEPFSRLPEELSSSDNSAPNLSHARRWVWVGVGVLSVVAFGVGALFGNIVDQRSKRKESTRQATHFLKDVEEQQTQIEQAKRFFDTLRPQLEVPKTSTAASAKDLLKQLQMMDWKKLDGARDTAFSRVGETDFGSGLVRDFINYYKILEQLHQQIGEFSVEMQPGVEALLERANVLIANQSPAATISTKQEDATGGFGLSIAENAKIPVAKLIEIVKQNCKKSEPKGGCAPENMEVSFRMDVNGRVFTRPVLVGDGGVIPILPTVLFQKLIVGSPRQLAYDRFKTLEGQLLRTFEAYTYTKEALKKKLQERIKSS